MKKDNPIQNGVDSALKEAGFAKKSTTWFRERDETFSIVNLQRSNFGEQYYVNLGVFIKGLTPFTGRFPKENDCHVRARLAELTPEELRLFDLEQGMPEQKGWEDQVATVVRNKALPFFSGLDSLDGVREAHRNGRLSDALIDRRVFEF